MSLRRRGKRKLRDNFDFSFWLNDSVSIVGPYEEFLKRTVYEFGGGEKVKALYVNGGMSVQWSTENYTLYVKASIYLQRKGQPSPTTMKTITRSRSLFKTGIEAYPSSETETYVSKFSHIKGVGRNKRKNMPLGMSATGRDKSFILMEKGDKLLIAFSFRKDPMEISKLPSYNEIRNANIKDRIEYEYNVAPKDSDVLDSAGPVFSHESYVSKELIKDVKFEQDIAHFFFSTSITISKVF